MNYALRPARPTDLPYVVDTWIKSARSPHERLRDATGRVRAIIAQPTTTLVVACLPDDDDAILGWACHTPDKMYSYVRRGARDQGLEKALTESMHT